MDIVKKNSKKVKRTMKKEKRKTKLKQKIKSKKINKKGGFLGFGNKKKSRKSSESSRSSKQQYYKKLLDYQNKIKNINIKNDLINNNGGELKKVAQELNDTVNPRTEDSNYSRNRYQRRY